MSDPKEQTQKLKEVTKTLPTPPGESEDDDHAVCFGGSKRFPGQPGPQDDRE